MRRLKSLFILPLLAGCANSTISLPDTTINTPNEWRAKVASDGPVHAIWWRAFGDAQLESLVAQALRNNVDLAIAEARVREARALAAQAQSKLWPNLEGSLSAQRAKNRSALTGEESYSSNAQGQMQISYEFDIWGRVRSANAAARASLQASRYANDAAALSVAANTARAYVQLASLDAQLEIAHRTLVTRKMALNAAWERASSGYTSRLELAQAEAESHDAAQQVPALELAVRQQENALRLLIGDLTKPVKRSRLQDLRLPAPAPGLPSALLARRPDIAEAEAELLVADMTLAADRAALLPQVSLTASLGRQFVRHIDPISIWSLGGSLLAPLFDGGQRQAQVYASTARRDQAAWTYRGTVLRAFAETEDALEGIDRLAAQANESEARRRALGETLIHAHNRYNAGYASYLEELDAQRGLYAAEQQGIRLQESQLLNAVNLYQALGGGWHVTENEI